MHWMIVKKHNVISFLWAIILGAISFNHLSAQGTPDSSRWNGSQYQLNSRSQTMDAQALFRSLDLNGIKSIIDLGCGSGNSMQVLREHFSDAFILGVDPEPTMLARAQQLFATDQRVNFLKAGALSFIAPAPVDLLYSGFTMHWIPKGKQLAVLKNISLNLNKKGKLILLFSSSKKGLPFQKVLDQTINKAPYNSLLNGFQDAQVFYQVDEYRNFLEQADFFVEHIGYSYNEKSYKNSSELRFWIQQWLSYAKELAKTSEGVLNAFMEELVQAFINETDQQHKEPVIWGEYVMSVVAFKK